MIKLSHSSINYSLQPNNSHNWLNRVMGIKPEERPEWKAGKKIHRIIQDHVAGIKPDKRFKHVDYTFPIVEVEDFDPRCKFEFDWKVSGNGLEYKIRGFLDGLDEKNKRFLEIKSSDPVWSLGKFQKSMQRKLYALAKPDFTEAILITCSKDQDKWKTEPAKVYKVPLTEQDRKEAIEWIIAAVKLLESGKFDGGLDKDGVCRDRWCSFGRNCYFK